LCVPESLRQAQRPERMATRDEVAFPEAAEPVEAGGERGAFALCWE
jgi:hypothetical protein